MKRLHQQLQETFSWYRSWHEHQHHALFHAFILFLFVVTLVSQIEITTAVGPNPNANDAAIYNPNNRKGGLLPDDPEKVKKVPRLVVTKDPKSVKAPIGESVVTMEPLAALPTTVLLATPPVLDQGGEGACVGFATATVRSIEEYYHTGATAYNIATNVFSPEHLYNDIIFSGDCNSGSAMQTAMDSLKVRGVSTLQSMPFSDKNGCHSFPNPEQVTEALGFRIGSYVKILSSDREAIKTMVANNHPVLINVIADNSFINNTDPNFIWKQYSGSGSLAHAIVIVGYDDAKNAYKIQNSWGADWGASGFGWIDYDFFLTRTGTYVYAINSLTSTDTIVPTVSLTAPLSGTTASGVTTLSATASDNTAIAGVRFRVDGVTVGAEDTTAPYSLDWNMAAFTTGSHSITAVARDTAGNLAVSTPVTISVVGGDTIAPASALITTPTAGATVSGLTSVILGGLDNNALKEVQLLLDGKPWLVALSPFQTILRTSTTDTEFISDGSHTLTAVAKDFANNIKTGVAQNVIVSNPPRIYSVGVTNRTASGVTITWTTNKPATSQVEYGTTTGLGLATPVSSTFVTSHSVTLTGLTPSTTYYYRVISKNAFTSTATSVTTSFATTAGTTDPDTTPPVVSLSTPVNGATVLGTISIAATASDNIGIAKVEFSIDNTLVNTDTSSPYGFSFDTTTLANGTHTIMAKAYDAAGNTANSGTVSITVNNILPDTIAPTISLTNPTNNSTISGTVSITASASDNVGIDHVDFYRGTTLVGADATAPYSLAWDTTTAVNGTYELSARAYDAAGNSTTASTVSVTVQNEVISTPDTTAPSTAILVPTNGGVVVGTATLTASATDNVGVAKVSFFRGTTLIDTDTTGSPNYSVAWDTTTVPNGTYGLIAKAYDAAGNVGSSTTIMVTVSNISADTVAPVAKISTNLRGTVITAKISSITIKGTATDNSGVIAKNELLINGTVVATNTNTTSISFKWNTKNLSTGSYTLTLRSYDAAGNVGTSGMILTK